MQTYARDALRNRGSVGGSDGNVPPDRGGPWGRGTRSGSTSGRNRAGPCSSTSAPGASSRRPSTTIATASSRVPAGPGRGRPPAAGLGAPGPDGLRPDPPGHGPRGPRLHGRRPGRRRRHRHRLHRLHDAADDRGRRAAVHDPGLPARAARLGEAVEAPRRPARGRPDQRRGPRARAEAWLPRYGGKISSEWFFSKSLQILDEAPTIYAPPTA